MKLNEVNEKIAELNNQLFENETEINSIEEEIRKVNEDYDQALQTAIISNLADPSPLDISDQEARLHHLRRKNAVLYSSLGNLNAEKTRLERKEDAEQNLKYFKKGFSEFQELRKLFNAFDEKLKIYNSNKSGYEFLRIAINPNEFQLLENHYNSKIKSLKNKII